MAYAMENLGWKFYFINAAWNFVFLIIAYFVFVETKGLTLEEIACRFEGKSHFISGVEESPSEDANSDIGKQGGVVTKSQEVN
jgi:hypothetical protein